MLRFYGNLTQEQIGDRLGISQMHVSRLLERALAYLRAHITDHPVQAVKDLTGGIGPDRIIDAVGIDAERPRSGPAAEQSAQLGGRFDDERHTTAPQASPRGRPREEDPTGSRRPEDRSAW
jgi:transcriptional regulator with XRE-family HTH domain